MRGLTPVRAIRAKCIDCSGGQIREVKECKQKSCKNWPYRHGKRPKPGSEEERVLLATMRRLTPIQAIRAKCKDCCAGATKEVKLCPSNHCPHWSYRHGKRPERGSEEERVLLVLGNLTIDELADAMTTASAIEEEVTHSRTETTVDRPEIESSINGDVGPSTCHRPESVLPKARGT